MKKSGLKKDKVTKGKSVGKNLIKNNNKNANLNKNENKKSHKKRTVSKNNAKKIIISNNNMMMNIMMNNNMMNSNMMMNNMIMNNMMNNNMMNQFNNPMFNNNMINPMMINPMINNPMLNNNIMNNPMINNQMINNPMNNFIQNPLMVFGKDNEKSQKLDIVQKMTQIRNKETNNKNQVISNSKKNKEIKEKIIQKNDNDTQKSNNSNDVKLKINNKNFSDDEIKEFKEAFDLFDVNNEGKIDPKELKKSLIDLEIDEKNKTKEKMIIDLNKFIEENKGKKMTFEEFVELFEVKEVNGSLSRESLKKDFDSMADEKNPNVITFDSFKKHMKEIGNDFSDEDIKGMILYASKNKKLEITFEEYCEVMNKL